MQSGEFLKRQVDTIIAGRKKKGDELAVRKEALLAIKAAVKEELGQLSSEIKELQNELRKEDKEKTKNFLVARLNEIENGETWSGIERQRFYEQYDHYTNDLNGNTYIKKAVEAHEKEGKIWR